MLVVLFFTIFDFAVTHLNERLKKHFYAGACREARTNLRPVKDRFSMLFYSNHERVQSQASEVYWLEHIYCCWG